MGDKNKTKDQLIHEVERLRNRLAELEESEVECRRAEDTLKEREKFLADILNSIQDGISILDKDLNIIQVNPTMEKWYAHKMPLVGKKCFEAYHGREEHCEICPSLRTLKSGKPSMEIVPFTGPEGVNGWLEVFSFPHVNTTSGRLMGIIEYVRDITDRKRAEEALRLTQFSVDHAGDAAYWTGLDAKFFYVNEEACRALGYSREELLSMTVHDIDPHFPKEVWREHWEDLRRRGSFTIESEHRAKDGRIFPVEVMVNYVRFNDREYNCAFARDITERKQAEEKLKMLTDELTRSNHELTHFASVTSHDLQSPLLSLMSLLKLLKRHLKGNLDPETERLVTGAHEIAMDMKTLIGNLLDYSRVDSRRRRFKTVDCETVLDRTLSNLQADIRDSGAIITHAPLPQVPGSAPLLVQLFQNLIGNAIKFSTRKTPRIHIAAKRKKEEWVFSFRDNGIGIDPKYADRIFEIFQRLHDKNEYPGSGIGLATCKKIVNLHGGHIWVKSEPGKGATFFITIPSEQK